MEQDTLSKNPEPKPLTIEPKVLDATLEYLASRPYKEVYWIINELLKVKQGK